MNKLLTLSIVILLVLNLNEVYTVQGRFSFALPGKWAKNYKRGGFKFSLPGKWARPTGKRDGAPMYDNDCPALDEESAERLFMLYQKLQGEIEDIMRCYGDELGWVTASAEDKSTI